MKLIIVGMGGIGSHLIYPLFQYLNYNDTLLIKEVVLVDGDKFEEKNKKRQMVTGIGKNKAVAAKEFYADEFTNLVITADPRYINTENIGEIIDNEDIILLCVDNNKTRQLVEEYCKTLDNFALISGGNELYDGNVQIVVKKEGAYQTPGLTEQHPEIAAGTDRHPDELSCEELSVSGSPQVSITNAAIADAMRRILFGYLQEGIRYNEVYINLKNGNLRVEHIDKRIGLYCG